MSQQPSEEEQIKRRLLWKKVSDPSFSEQSKPQNARPKSSIDKVVVPMIPSDMLAGSSSDVNENKTFRNMSINPLVPIGMALTVGCLIGMCKASLNRNMMRTQYYMRGRIAAQGFTVLALVGGAIFFGLDPRGYAKPGAIPRDSPDVFTQKFLGNKS